MAEQTFVTHLLTRSPFSQGPVVRDMYAVMDLLGYHFGLLPAQVRVLASRANALADELEDEKHSLFRNESSLDRYFDSSEPDYVPHDQRMIDRLLDLSDRAKALLSREGERPLAVASLDLINRNDRGGSYIVLNNELIKARIEYVNENLAYGIRVGLLESLFGSLAGTVIAGLGIM